MKNVANDDVWMAKRSFINTWSGRGKREVYILNFMGTHLINVTVVITEKELIFDS